MAKEFTTTNFNKEVLETYEQSAINGDNEIRKEYQRKLLCLVLDYLTKRQEETRTSKETNGFFSLVLQYY